MFCSNCGAEVYIGEKYCLKCGCMLKADVRDVSSAYPPSPAPTVRISGAPSGKSSKKNAANKLLRILLSLILILLVTGVCAFIALNWSDSCSACLGTEPDSESADIISFSDSSAVSTAQNDDGTTATQSDTTTSTTTTTTVNAQLAKADRIRNLLVSKTWNTTFEGYDAVITFESSGVAHIAVKVKVGFFYITETVDAEYSVSDECRFILNASYGSTDMRFAGEISAQSDSVLLVELDNNKGSLRLTAA